MGLSQYNEADQDRTQQPVAGRALVRMAGGIPRAWVRTWCSLERTQDRMM